MFELFNTTYFNNLKPMSHISGRLSNDYPRGSLGRHSISGSASRTVLSVHTRITSLASFFFTYTLFPTLLFPLLSIDDQRRSISLLSFLPSSFLPLFMILFQYVLAYTATHRCNTWISFLLPLESRHMRRLQHHLEDTKSFDKSLFTLLRSSIKFIKSSLAFLYRILVLLLAGNSIRKTWNEFHVGREVADITLLCR